MPYYPQTPSYAPPNPLSYRNILGRNGGFEVWQRGAGGSAVIQVTGGAYTVDGWYLTTSSTACAVSQTPGIGGSRWAALVQRNPGQAGVGGLLFECPLDTDEIAPARGSIVTLSVLLWGGANFSPAGGTINFQLFTGTDAPKKRDGVAYTNETTVINGAAAVVIGNYVRFTFTSSVVVPTNTTCASLLMIWTPTGTAGAQDGFVIDDVQLEVGNVATPFERRPFESELAACRRHYWKTFNYEIAPAAGLGIARGEYGWLIAAAGGFVSTAAIRHPVEMRVLPTVTFYNPSVAGNQVRNMTGGVDHNTTGLWSAAPQGTMVISTGNAANVAGHTAIVQATFDAGI